MSRLLAPLRLVRLARLCALHPGRASTVAAVVFEFALIGHDERRQKLSRGACVRPVGFVVRRSGELQRGVARVLEILRRVEARLYLSELPDAPLARGLVLRLGCGEFGRPPLVLLGLVPLALLPLDLL
jgi:hypothetical protein